MPRFVTKRAYDPPSSKDGVRILVDRLWPRGLRKDAAALDLWAKELAPSPALRKWFDHRPERFAEFKRRYRDELKRILLPSMNFATSEEQRRRFCMPPETPRSIMRSCSPTS
jgi:uncharacterized protein YeaO (DUF488 family)